MLQSFSCLSSSDEYDPLSIFLSNSAIFMLMLLCCCISLCVKYIAANMFKPRRTLAIVEPDLTNFHQSLATSPVWVVIDGSLYVKCLVAYINAAMGASKNG